MKTNRFLSLALLALIISTGSLFSQTNQFGRRAEGQGGIANRMMQGPDRAMLNVLTDDQRTSYRQALDTQRAKLRELETKMVEARKDLTAVSASATFDENAVRAKAAYIGNIEVEMAVVRARALSQIQPPLTADQLERMKNVSPAGEFPARPRDGAGSTSGTGDDSPVHPTKRSTQRDENDLPAAAKP
jgi:Spy/CpxP family protein refolding chaperone